MASAVPFDDDHWPLEVCPLCLQPMAFMPLVVDDLEWQFCGECGMVCGRYSQLKGRYVAWPILTV